MGEFEVSFGMLSCIFIFMRILRKLVGFLVSEIIREVFLVIGEFFGSCYMKFYICVRVLVVS